MRNGIYFAHRDDEREAVFNQRYRIYVEDKKRYADRADHDNKRLVTAEDANARQLMAVDDGQLIATMRIVYGADAPFSDALQATYEIARFSDLIAERDILVLEHFLIDPAARGGGVTMQLMLAAAGFAVENGVEMAFCATEPDLLNQYLQLGFRPYAGSQRDPDGGVQIPLLFAVKDREYLQSVGSPMARMAWERAADGIDDGLRQRLDEVAPVPGQPAEAAGYWQPVRGELLMTKNHGPRLFDDFDPAEMTRLLEQGNVLECADGVRVIKAGAATRAMYILLSGLLEVHRSGRLVRVIVPGSVFGEVAFLLGTSRSADVYAVAPKSRLLALSDSTVAELIEADSVLAAKLMTNLARSVCARFAAQ